VKNALRIFVVENKNQSSINQYANQSINEEFSFVSQRRPKTANKLVPTSFFRGATDDRAFR
jgi:hypothetical protein